MASMMPVMMLMVNLSSIAIIWFGSIRVAGGHLETGAMFAFLQYAAQILFCTSNGSYYVRHDSESRGSAKRVNEVLENGT